MRPERSFFLVPATALSACLVLSGCAAAHERDSSTTSGGSPGTGSASSGGGGGAAATGGRGGSNPEGGGGASPATGGTAGTGGNQDSGGTPATGGAPNTTGSKGTTNLFSEVLGESQAAVDAKVTTAVNRYFGIGTGESSTPTAGTGYRCYYEMPGSSNSAYIWAADSNDVRSEGMSYGMMIAVQMGMQTEFDRLWRFAKEYMQITSGTWQNYFNWQGQVNGGSASFNNSGPAPDGDEYFAVSLYLADKRWGSSGGIDYKQEADAIATSFLHNQGQVGGNCPIFDLNQNQVVFFPAGTSCNITDPSYHLPAFYEVFALYGPSGDASKWRTIASTSRSFFVSSAHRSTGLHPDYAQFTGAATSNSANDGHDKFHYDAWRVIMNMGIDYVWFSKDSKLKAQAEKYHSFFSTYLQAGNVTQSLFNLDGSGAEGGGSTALTGTLAVGAFASAASNRKQYIQNLWDVAQQSGQYRYYQESVYLLALLAVAGKYAYAW